MSVVILQDEVVHYEVLGRGRPLIFLHSWVGSWRYWIPAMQAASVAFRAYALDLWGFGDTARNPEKYTLDQQCSLLESFMEKMGVPRAALIGHGLGAAVALRHAASRSDQVDRVMAVGYPLDGQVLSPRLRSATPAELAEWLLSKDPLMDAARAGAPRADAQAIRASLDSLQALRLSDLFPRLPAPSLFIQGGNDPVLLAAPLPAEPVSLPETAHQILFEDAGHFPMLEETNQFNRLLVDFLALSSGESPRHLQLKEEWKRRVR